MSFLSLGLFEKEARRSERTVRRDFTFIFVSTMLLLVGLRVMALVMYHD